MCFGVGFFVRVCVCEPHNVRDDNNFLAFHRSSRAVIKKTAPDDNKTLSGSIQRSVQLVNRDIKMLRTDCEARCVQNGIHCSGAVY